jgi:hypothetical protein
LYSPQCSNEVANCGNKIASLSEPQSGELKTSVYIKSTWIHVKKYHQKLHKINILSLNTRTLMDPTPLMMRESFSKLSEKSDRSPQTSFLLSMSVFVNIPIMAIVDLSFMKRENIL